MARAVNRLSARQVAALTEVGRHADGDGLYLVVKPGGSKVWTLMAKVAGKRHEYGLGSVKQVSLAEAREAARAMRERIRAGEDPRSELRQIPTFAELSRQWIEEQAPTWRGRDTKAHWERSLLVYAAKLGPKRVDRIETTDVLEVLRDYWLTRPETGRKLRQRIEAVCDVAIVKGWTQGANPARLRGHLDKVLPRQPRTVKHRRAVDYTDMPDVMAKLAASDAMSARAMEWTILTAAREGMTRFAVWGDIQGDLWVVPAAKMKEIEGGDFRVPLTSQALAVLDRVRPAQVDPTTPIFTSIRNRPISDQTMDKLLTTLGIDATPHGFRSTFRDWAGDETSHPRDIAEMALAHSVGSDTERAYRRKDALEKRRRLMTDWADFIAPLPEPAPAPRD